MKKIYFLFIVLFFVSLTTSAQVDVVSTGGTPTQSYLLLKDAFDAINLGTHTGTITIGISGNTAEAASAVLNASGNGAASYATITISPTGGVARTISGNLFGPLIDLNGADNVTINGLNSGGNSLTIGNAALGASNAIRFINDASGNTITKCTLQSSSTASGVVFFSTGTTTGNDNNTVSNCDITGVGANLPQYGIYAFGTSTYVDNSNNIINANNIFDYFNGATQSAGMYVALNCHAWTITNNKLYQTASRTYGVASTLFGVLVNGGSGFNISGNTIG